MSSPDRRSRTFELTISMSEDQFLQTLRHCDKVNDLADRCNEIYFLLLLVVDLTNSSLSFVEFSSKCFMGFSFVFGRGEKCKFGIFESGTGIF